MLSALDIRNYALIEELNISFDQGFSIITGETGAGKSILLGALSLLLGQRADTGVLRQPDRKAVVEGTFAIEEYNLQWFFSKYELDYDPQTIIRREISPAGKSRAFINDTPVNLNQLREIGAFLVDIHSQHQTLQINDASFQLNLIDVFSGQLKARKSYEEGYHKWRKLKKELNEALDAEQKARQDQDYYRFQLNELSEADLKEDEQDALETELKTIQHVEEIKSALFQVVHHLSLNEENVLSGINAASQQLTAVAGFHSDVEQLNERLNSCRLELEDLSAELENLQETIDFEPGRLEELNDRIDLIYQLQRKHGVNSNAELLNIQQELEGKLSGVDQLSESISYLQGEIAKQETIVMKKAQKLSSQRKKSFGSLQKKVGAILTQVGMANAQLMIDQQTLEEPDKTGLDKIRFLFSANKGLELRELGKVASGGELSRLMLALKAILAELTALPTIIFDEIDTGVSGDIASKMAIILKNMSQHMQVLSITHLPQVAARGDFHYKVYKEDTKGKTISNLVRLDEEVRLEELARMLSGEKVSEAALENARDLLGYT